jgi:glycosyltransferase involved in cell wall biosynthesis
VISQAVETSDPESTLRKIRFLYHDLGGAALWLKRHGLLPTAVYYVFWQLSAFSKFREFAESMDVVHHLTFCNLLCPGFWKLRKAAFVIGPVGAPRVPAPYLPLFGKAALPQKLRALVLENFHRIPWLRRQLERAAAIIPANSDTRRLLESRGFRCEDAMLDTGAPEATWIAKEHDPDTVRFVSAGRLERRKGLELALRAFAMAAPRLPRWTYTLIGDGPDTPRLRQLAQELGIANHVEFTGLYSHEETLESLRTSDVFVFTSIRDTSGSVNLEAMANGLPVICIAHQGVGDITDESCAERIPAGSVPATVGDLANAIARLATKPDLRSRMGKAAAHRASRQFAWDDKFDRMVGIYETVGRGGPAAPTSPAARRDRP